MSKENTLPITSNTARAFLQNANQFGTLDKAVWEYVANSLQYIDKGTTPNVKVKVNQSKKTITISDNGSGMSEDGLKTFLTLHARNERERQGQAGRGFFGTGKTAALGIGKSYTLETIQNKVANGIRLDRSEIYERANLADAQELPVERYKINEPTDLPNGTIVTIQDIDKKLSTASVTTIIRKIEEELGHWYIQGPMVYVNKHHCEYQEPDIVGEPIVFRPDPNNAELFGDVELKIKRSAVPLDKTKRGIAICHETAFLARESAGVDSKPHGDHLWGDVMIPKLKEEMNGITIVTSSRDHKLNSAYPLTQPLKAWIGLSLESVRKKIEKETKQHRDNAERKKLDKHGEQIADLLNQHWKDVSKRFDNIAPSSNKGSTNPFHDPDLEGIGDEGLEGNTLAGTVEENNQDGKLPTFSPDPPPPIPNIDKKGKIDPDGLDLIDPKNETKKRRKKPKGGFSVRYENLGAEKDRAYCSDSHNITINLDHPVLKATLKNSGGIDDINFKRIAVEIALGEYAHKIGTVLTVDDPNAVAEDVLPEVRRYLNEISRIAAELYL
tara:strand:- start:2896 stop:4560 length:1665 start_codon:yes stop_codon:yes gene_type:complete